MIYRAFLTSIRSFTLKCNLLSRPGISCSLLLWDMTWLHAPTRDAVLKTEIWDPGFSTWLPDILQSQGLRMTNPDYNGAYTWYLVDIHDTLLKTLPLRRLYDLHKTLL